MSQQFISRESVDGGLWSRGDWNGLKWLYVYVCKSSKLKWEAKTNKSTWFCNKFALSRIMLQSIQPLFNQSNYNLLITNSESSHASSDQPPIYLTQGNPLPTINLCDWDRWPGRFYLTVLPLCHRRRRLKSVEWAVAQPSSQSVSRHSVASPCKHEQQRSRKARLNCRS